MKTKCFRYFRIRRDIGHPLCSSEFLNFTLLGTQLVFSSVWAIFNAHWRLEWILENTTFCVEDSVDPCNILGFVPHND